MPEEGASTGEQTSQQRASISFWNTWCQSYNSGEMALGEITPESLERYDRAYLRYYPYLLKRILPGEMVGKRVLEIGLGFGTLGQKIAEAGADYVGMDVARNQVDLMTYRMRIQGLEGEALQADFLSNDLPSESFDFVLSVGCFHHTGDIPGCVHETYRLLRHGGSARIIIYNRFSLRQWTRWPVKTLHTLGGEAPRATREQRLTYDPCDGEAAPITEFTSRRQAERLFQAFSDVRIRKENCDPVRILGFTVIGRQRLLRWVGPVLGLDLYIEAVK